MGAKVSLTRQILDEVRTISADLTGLRRQVDRIDERLADVEQHTKLIPGIAEAVGSHSTDLDNHERRITELEKARSG